MTGCPLDHSRWWQEWDEVRVGDNGVFDVFLLDSQYGWALVGSFEPPPIGLASPFS